MVIVCDVVSVFVVWVDRVPQAVDTVIGSVRYPEIRRLNPYPASGRLDSSDQLDAERTVERRMSQSEAGIHTWAV
jgi:hypothetical protein